MNQATATAAELLEEGEVLNCVLYQTSLSANQISTKTGISLNRVTTILVKLLKENQIEAYERDGQTWYFKQ